MKAIISRIIASPGVYLGTLSMFPIIYIILIIGLGYEGLSIGIFFMFLSCVSILPSSKVLMFEASLPGKRSNIVMTRYILALLIITFYTVLALLFGLGKSVPGKFGHNIYFVMLIVSLEYPAMFFLPEKLWGFVTGFLSAFLVITLNTIGSSWASGSWADFLKWIVLGLPTIMFSGLVTARIIDKRGVTC